MTQTVAPSSETITEDLGLRAQHAVVSIDMATIRDGVVANLTKSLDATAAPALKTPGTDYNPVFA